jgi:hypothetical protein
VRSAEGDPERYARAFRAYCKILIAANEYAHSKVKAEGRAAGGAGPA